MRTLTLFMGAGLADAGLSAAGCEHVLGVEWDADAAEASRRNGLPCVTGDVRDLAIYDGLEDTIDLLWSSFPCQDFSTAGKRQGAKGERNGWPWSVGVIDRVRPTWLIAENVRGLTMHVGDCPTRHDGEQEDPESCPRCYLDGVIVPQLEQRFAWVEWRVLDSADYGVPQRRRRVYIIAGPRPVEWPKRTYSGEALAKAKWVTGDYWREAPTGEPSAQEQRWLDELKQPGLFRVERPAFGLEPWVTVRQALGLGGVLGGGRNPGEPGATDRRLRNITDEPSTTIAAQSGGGARNAGPFVAWRKGEHPELLDKPSPAVSATEVKGTNGKESTGWTAAGGPARASDALWLATGRRRLSVEECARLMAAPEGWVFHGTKSARYRQVGNGVTPPVSEALARAVRKASR